MMNGGEQMKVDRLVSIIMILLDKGEDEGYEEKNRWIYLLVSICLVTCMAFGGAMVSYAASSRKDNQQGND